MPDAKISELTAITGANLAAADVFAVEDISATTTKKITKTELLNVCQPIDATLTALAAYDTNGLLVQTATDTFVGRTIAAGSSKISVSNGDGVSGNPSVDLGTVNVEDLSDVTITTIASGELLKWNGAAWINNTLAEAGISATGHTHTESDITDLQSYLLNITGENLSALADVTITTIASGEMLQWSGSAWINQTFAELGLAETTNVVLRDGTQGLSADWDAGSHKITAEQLESDIVTGTAPIVVASTTLVSNLNADQVDGIEGAEIVQRDGSVAMTGDFALGTNRITGLGTPTADTDAATKGYVDAAIEGLAWKDSVVAASTAAGTLATDFENADVLDGVTLATGDRILLKDQAAGAENGIYTVNASGAPTRAVDLDTGSGASGAATFVEEGTTNADLQFLCSSNEGSDVVGTDALTWATYGAGGGGGETNTASNVGTDGVGVFKQKTGVDLEFRHVAAASAKITVVNNADDIDIDFGSVAITDLSDVASKSGTGTVAIMQGSPTITTPTIASFTNSTHDHTNAAGGGQLDHGAALTGLTDDDHTQYVLLAGRATGQDIIGGTASGDDLTLESTSNATKGHVQVKDDLQIDKVARFDAEYDNGNSGTTPTVDWGNGNFQKITLTGNATFTLTAPDGPGWFTLRVIQDATAGRTVTWPGSVVFPTNGTESLSSDTNGQVRIFTFHWDGTTYRGGQSPVYAS